MASRRISPLILASLLAVALVAWQPAGADADRGRARSAPPRAKPAATAPVERVDRIRKISHPLRSLTPAKKKTVKGYLSNRLKWTKARGELFRRIAVNGDYTNNYVLHRDRNVTAFLDWSDPKHPEYKPDRKTGEQRHLDKIPESRRAHILVVPNSPREHIGQSLGGQIGLNDLEVARKTVKSAHKLAKKLGIRNPQIFVNSENGISVGYLHVHIIGEKTKGVNYPKQLSPPRKR